MTSLLTDTPLPHSLSPGHLNLLLCEAKGGSGGKVPNTSTGSAISRLFACPGQVALTTSSPVLPPGQARPSAQTSQLLFLVPITLWKRKGSVTWHMGRQGPRATEGHGPRPRTSKWTDGDPNMGQLTLTPCSTCAPTSLSLFICKTKGLEWLSFQLFLFMTWCSLVIGSGFKWLQRPSICQIIIKLAAWSEVWWKILCPCPWLSLAWWWRWRWQVSRGFGAHWGTGLGHFISSHSTQGDTSSSIYISMSPCAANRTFVHSMTQSLWFILIEKSTRLLLPKHLVLSYLIPTREYPARQQRLNWLPKGRGRVVESHLALAWHFRRCSNLDFKLFP